MSSPGSDGSARRRGLLIVFALFATMFVLAPMSAYGDPGDDGAAENATAEDATATDLFTVTPAQAATLRAAHPAQAKGPTPDSACVSSRTVPRWSRAATLSSRSSCPTTWITDDMRVEVDGRDVTSAFAARADGTFGGIVEGLRSDKTRSWPADEEGEGQAHHPPDDQEPPLERPGLLRPATAAVDLRAAGGDADRGHDPRYEPDRDRQYEGQRPRGSSGCQLQRARRSTRTSTSRQRGTPANCTFTQHRRNPCFEPYDLGEPAAPSRHRQLHQRPRRHGQEHRPRRARHDQSRHLRARDVLRPDASRTRPGTPQKGWNGKLLWIVRRRARARAASRADRHAASSTTTALSRGFMVATSSLTDHGTNANDTLAAETMMMVKERITETYGADPLHDGRRLLGRLDHAAEHRGGLPGPAERHPAELHLPGHVHHRDRGRWTAGCCGRNYYTTPNGAASRRRSATRSTATTAPGLLRGLDRVVPARRSTRRGASNCGAGCPAALTYDKVLRPQGVRCTAADHDAAMRRDDRRTPTGSSAATRRSTTSACSTA